MEEWQIVVCLQYKLMLELEILELIRCSFANHVFFHLFFYALILFWTHNPNLCLVGSNFQEQGSLNATTEGIKSWTYNISDYINNSGHEYQSLDLSQCAIMWRLVEIEACKIILVPTMWWNFHNGIWGGEKKYEHGFHEECELQTLILNTCMYYCFWCNT